MKARDFLADHNLALRGKRGKFSKEAKEFLAKAITEGQAFEDWNVNGRIVPVHVPRVKKTAVVSRKPLAAAPVSAKTRPRYSAIRIVDHDGISVTIDFCVSCSNSVSRCTCSQSPSASAFLTKDALSVTLIPFI